jgi:hypothetical protein
MESEICEWEDSSRRKNSFNWSEVYLVKKKKKKKLGCSIMQRNWGPI